MDCALKYKFNVDESQWRTGGGGGSTHILLVLSHGVIFTSEIVVHSQSSNNIELTNYFIGNYITYQCYIQNVYFV
jgi:uncharacterized membrane protein YecN with MAPEG domain